MKRLIVTTSWDDGHKLDVRLAALLRKYNLPGTFYVSPFDREFPKKDLLTDAEVRALSKEFEIGAHTMTHPRLPDISDDEARREMRESKEYLEGVTGKPIVSFCYPGGEYNRQHPGLAEEVGFSYARTVKRHINDLHGSVFEAHTSVNAYNHYQDLPKIFKFAGYNPSKVPHYFKWENLAKAMFDKLRREGGIFHLWGHSWEIDQHGDWDKLEEVLRYISGHSDVIYATNGELPVLQPKNLLMVAPYFPPHLGGQEQYAYNIAKRLQDNYGWDVKVATTGERGISRTHELYKGVHVYRLPYWFKLSNTPINPLWPLTLRRFIAKHNIAAINAHAPVPGFGDIAVMVGKHIPSAITYHMASMKKNDKRFDWLIALYETRFLPAVLRRATATIATSRVVKDMHMETHAIKTRTITPGTDTTFFTPAKTLAKDTVLFVGSMNKSDKHKGLAYLIDAFASIAADRPGVKLVLVGDGTARSDFERQVEDLGLQDRVTFLGALFGEDLRRAYQGATVLVLPSLNENFALVTLEAMACGLPVVGTNVGAISDIIDDAETGYLIPPADSQAIAEKVSYLLSHPTKAAAMGRQSRKKAETTFSWDHKVRDTDTILRRIMGIPAEASK
ncbi:MAG TPA: glycosyltransferase [Candidatus Saccharimonadales bacterium]|nr:glycosyltransferase [Candidatus Saccharimonadales bacterium]